VLRDRIFTSRVYVKIQDKEKNIKIADRYSENVSNVIMFWRKQIIYIDEDVKPGVLFTEHFRVLQLPLGYLKRECQNVQRYNFTYYFVWICNLVSRCHGKTQFDVSENRAMRRSSRRVYSTSQGRAPHAVLETS
jgi:hypothetical protein